MADASWDNSGLPPRKQGMPTWGKVLLGCGVLSLLFVGTCAAFLGWTVNRAANEGQVQWPAYVEAVKALQEPATTKALYEANPGLSREFTDAEAFEKQVAEWRPALQVPPRVKPPLTSGRAIAFGGKSTKFKDGRVSREHGTVTGYRMEDGRMLIVSWQDGKILDIQLNKQND